MGVELLWVQIQGKETNKDKVLFTYYELTQVEIGNITDKSISHSSYAAFPIYYRHEIGKLGLRAGFQTMVFLFASSRYTASGEFEGNPLDIDSKTKGIKFDPIDIGPKLGLDFKLNEALHLRADYYHGMVDVVSDSFFRHRRNRQVAVGVNYLIFGRSNTE